MEKMCTAKTAIDNGYTTDLTMDEKECITTEEFLGHFSKEHYSASINGDRQSNQLFPFADVVETKIILTPSITFGNDEMKVNYNVGSFTNTFTVENIDANSLGVTMRNDTNSGFTNNGTVTVTNNRITMKVDDNSGIPVWNYTVTLTGNRTDGEGTYGKSFVVKQWYRTIPMDINNGSSSGGKVLIARDSDGNEAESVVSGVIMRLKADTRNTSEYLYAQQQESNKWTIMYEDGSSFRYTLTLKDKSGMTINTKEGNSVTSVSVAYNELINCESATMWTFVN